MELACAVVNSAAFYWWWTKGSNCRDLNVEEVLSFPIDLNGLGDTAALLQHKHAALMKDFVKNSEEKVRVQKQTGAVHYREFNPVRSKDLIDDIDHLLAAHYGFSNEELDYIINYDIKYRMGDELDGDGTDDGAPAEPKATMAKPPKAAAAKQAKGDTLRQAQDIKRDAPDPFG